MKSGLDIRLEKGSDGVTVNLTGEIGIETCGNLKNRLFDLYENNYKEIIINMSGVTLITSMGIAVLVHIHNYILD